MQLTRSGHSRWWPSQLILVLGRRSMNSAHVALVLGVAMLSGCDRFFTLHVGVTDCRSKQPLAGVKAVLRLDRGYGEPDAHGETDSAGHLRILINEPPSSWATLTLEHPGYRSWSKQFRGAPQGDPLTACLEKSAAGSAGR